jgi:large subunit ribosomal protein L21
MSKIAVIKTGGKQYKVKEGDSLKIEKLKEEAGAKIKFDTLMTSLEDGNDLNLGAPTLGDIVDGEVVEHGKADKILVVKFKNKTRYTRTNGHRQSFTKVKINKIS